MKKIILSLSTIAMMVSPIGIGVAGAQTATQAQIDLINQLNLQIQLLRDRMAGVSTQQQANASVVLLLRSLGLGSRGDDVKVLQAMLAADSSIYAEGLITGFYGPATARAVAKFQAKNGINATSFVGPLTRAALSEEFEGRIAIETDVNGVRRPCAKIPPGHLIAAGWLRKHDGIRPIVPLCQILPPGISGSLQGSATISAIATSNVSANGATVSWITNENTTGRVFFSANSAANTSTSASVSSSSSGTMHAANLVGLTANTTYYFVVEARDNDGNITLSAQQSFNTNSTVDLTPPSITGSVSANATLNGAVISWSTNENSNSKVYFSALSPVNISTSASISDSAMVTNHSVTLTNLNANTTYYFIVESRDSSNNLVLSSQGSFMASATADLGAPVISSISASSVSSTGATIHWNTNENATGKVFYSTSAQVDLNTSANVSANALATSQAVNLSGLQANTTYNFVIQARDSSGNTSNSASFSFTTSASSSGDTSSPIISGVNASLTASSTVVNWMTNESTTGKVYFSASTPVNPATAQVVTSASLAVNHTVVLPGLSSNTTYYMVIEARDSSGNVSSSIEYQFRTLTQ